MHSSLGISLTAVQNISGIWQTVLYNKTLLYNCVFSLGIKKSWALVPGDFEVQMN